MWVKLDDSFPDHPKVEALSDRAFRVHVRALCYAGRMLTDGFVPGQVASKWGTRAVAECVRSGLWENTTPHGYVVHDFLQYNPPRAAIERKRADARARRSRNADGTFADTSRDVRGNVPPPRPDPYKNIKTYAADAAPESNGWVNAPGLSGPQNHFVTKLGGSEAWIKATNTANRKHDRAVVTTALGHIAESPPAETRNVYALLEAECQQVEAREVPA